MLWEVRKAVSLGVLFCISILVLEWLLQFCSNCKILPPSPFLLMASTVFWVDSIHKRSVHECLYFLQPRLPGSSVTATSGDIWWKGPQLIGSHFKVFFHEKGECELLLLKLPTTVWLIPWISPALMSMRSSLNRLQVTCSPLCFKCTPLCWPSHMQWQHNSYQHW